MAGKFLKLKLDIPCPSCQTIHKKTVEWLLPRNKFECSCGYKITSFENHTMDMLNLAYKKARDRQNKNNA